MRMFERIVGGVTAACLVVAGVVPAAWGDERPDTTKETPSVAKTEDAENATEAKQKTPPVHEREVIVAMWKKNNELRASVGLEPHRLSPELCKAAQDHAEYMARTGVFDHYANAGPSGRAVRHGYAGSVRENIAMGYGNVEAAFAGWRSSGGHWASIVSGTQDAGFGYAVGPGGAPYYVGVYGYPVQRVARPIIRDTGDEDTPAETVSQGEAPRQVTYTSRRGRRRGRRRR